MSWMISTLVLTAFISVSKGEYFIHSPTAGYIQTREYTNVTLACGFGNSKRSVGADGIFLTWSRVRNGAVRENLVEHAFAGERVVQLYKQLGLRIQYSAAPRGWYNLTLINCSREDIANYTCKLTTPGTINLSSRPIQLFVLFAPTPPQFYTSTIIDELKVIAATPTPVSCRSRGGGPYSSNLSLSLDTTEQAVLREVTSWYSSSSNQSGINGSLTATGHVGFSITCHLQHPALPATGLSKTVPVYVLYKPRVHLEVTPTGPWNEGTVIHANCVADASPPASKFNWRRTYETLEPTTKSLSMTLQWQDHGHVLGCSAVNDIGESDTTWHVLNVTFGPRFILKPPSVKSDVTLGQTLQLSCLASANPDPKIYWMKNGHVVSNGSVLNITQLQNRNLGEYVCIATSGGESVQTTTLITLSTPPVVRAIKQEPTIDGTSVHLYCDVQATPEADMTWYRQGIRVTLSERIQQRRHSSGSGPGWVLHELQIDNVTAADGGVYNCTAENMRGTGSATIELDLNKDGESTTKEDSAPVYVIIVAVLCSLLLLFGVAILVFCLIRRHRRKILSKSGNEVEREIPRVTISPQPASEAPHDGTLQDPQKVTDDVQASDDDLLKPTAKNTDEEIERTVPKEEVDAKSSQLIEMMQYPPMMSDDIGCHDQHGACQDCGGYLPCYCHIPDAVCLLHSSEAGNRTDESSECSCSTRSSGYHGAHSSSDQPIIPNNQSLIQTIAEEPEQIYYPRSDIPADYYHLPALDHKPVTPTLYDSGCDDCFPPPADFANKSLRRNPSQLSTEV